MNLQSAFDCEMNCEIECVSKHCVNIIPQDECSICLDEIESGKNKLVTECGHMFHTSCLLKNASINGFGCPMCRTVLAEEEVEEAEEDDAEEDEELYTEHSLRGMRWLFQQARGEDIEEEDEDMDEYDDDSDDDSVYNVPTIDEVMQRLQIHSVTMVDVVKALISSNYGGYDDHDMATDEMFALLDRIVVDNEQPTQEQLDAIEVNVAPCEVQMCETQLCEVQVSKVQSIQVKPSIQVKSTIQSIQVKRNSSLNHGEATNCWYL